MGFIVQLLEEQETICIVQLREKETNNETRMKGVDNVTSELRSKRKLLDYGSDRIS